jgi:hypothetical protein
MVVMDTNALNVQIIWLPLMETLNVLLPLVLTITKFWEDHKSAIDAETVNLVNHQMIEEDVLWLD